MRRSGREVGRKCKSKWDERCKAGSYGLISHTHVPAAVATWTIVHDVRLTVSTTLISSGGTVAARGAMCRPAANDKRLEVGKVMR